MWIFLNNAFLSIVDKGGDGSTLLVRGRNQGDIERVFPGAEVSRTPNHDYLFRARIARDVAAEALANAVRGVTYGNFKGSVKESDRHDAYMKVWTAMHAFQNRKRPGRIEGI